MILAYKYISRINLVLLYLTICMYVLYIVITEILVQNAHAHTVVYVKRITNRNVDVELFMHLDNFDYSCVCIYYRLLHVIL